LFFGYFGLLGDVLVGVGGVFFGEVGVVGI